MLRQSLTNFATKMDHEFPLMNRGGCAVFAAHIAKRLQHIVPTRIKLCDYEHSDLDQIRPLLSDPLHYRSWRHSGIHYVHLIVEFDYDGQTYHYDSEGLRLAQPKWEGYPICDGSFTVDEVASFAANRDAWNSTFNRSRIPVLKRRIKTLFARNLNHNFAYDYILKN